MAKSPYPQPVSRKHTTNWGGTDTLKKTKLMTEAVEGLRGRKGKGGGGDKTMGFQRRGFDRTPKGKEQGEGERDFSQFNKSSAVAKQVLSRARQKRKGHLKNKIWDAWEQEAYAWVTTFGWHLAPTEKKF